MRTSSRGEVDPFIVMDVMEAARAEEARGALGDPHGGGPARHAGARRGAGGAGAGDGSGAARLHGGAGPAGAPGADRAALPATGTGVDLDPGRVVVTAGSSAGFILAFTSLFDARRRGWRSAIPGYPSYRNILRALDLVPVGIETGPENRFQPVAARSRRPDLGRGARGEPGQSDRDDAGAPGACGADRARRRSSGSAFVSDEIYHGIHYGARAVSRAGDLRRGLRDQLLLQVLLDDRLADRLDGGAGGARPPIERLVQNLFICAPHASQVAALARARRRRRSWRRTSRSIAPTGR